jgi:hypothetical protein
MAAHATTVIVLMLIPKPLKNLGPTGPPDLGGDKAEPPSFLPKCVV